MGLQTFLLAEPGGEPAHLPGGEGDVGDTELVAELSQGLVLGGPGLDGGVGISDGLEKMCLHVEVVAET